MDIPLDEVIHFDAITSTPSTGAAVDADSAPTFEVFEEATDTDIGVGGSMTKRTSKTGNYRGTFALSAANGFEVGKWYNVIGSGVVGGVTGKARLKHFRVVAAEAIAGKPKVDVDAWLGTAAATPTVAGVPEVDVTHVTGTAASAVSGAIDANVTKWNGTAVPAEHTVGYPIVTIKDGTGTGEINTDAGTVALSAASIAAIVAAFGGVSGAIEDDIGNSTTVFQTNLAETQNDYYNGGVVVFTSGTNIGQVRRISDYVGATGTVTVDTAFDAEPDAADAFIILGRIQ